LVVVGTFEGQPAGLSAIAVAANAVLIDDALGVISAFCSPLGEEKWKRRKQDGNGDAVGHRGHYIAMLHAAFRRG
jgi:hypothetical protein